MLWLRKDYLNRNRKILLILKRDIWKHEDNLWRLVHRQEKSGKGGRQRKGKEIEGEAKRRGNNLNSLKLLRHMIFTVTKFTEEYQYLC